MHSFVSLMYHNVVRKNDRFPRLSPSVTSYFVKEAAFADHVALLCEQGRCVDWEEVCRFYVADTKSRCQPPQSLPAVQITFDDGWLGSVDVAGPILESYGCQAILFVTTELVNRHGFVDRGRLQRLPQETFLVGSHTRTHRRLNRLSENEMRQELIGSKQFLEDATGHSIDAVSIPGGSADRRVRRIAIEVGYQYVFTSGIHINTRAIGPERIGRVAIKEVTTLDNIRRYVSSNLTRERARSNLLNIPKRLLGAEHYDTLRRRLLGETAEQLDMTDLSISGDPDSQDGSVIDSLSI